VEKTKYVLQFEQNYSATWFNGGFVRIMAKKRLRGNPFTNDKLFTETGYICAEKETRVDDEVERLWSVFARRFSVVRRNPQGGQAG
jgi:hypothetical protein